MSHEQSETPAARRTLGAIPDSQGVSFRVWAPKPSLVGLDLRSGDSVSTIPMERDGEYWAVHVPEARAGHRYKYKLDGGESYPDPASRSQPEGVHGPSEVVDPGAFSWSDSGWQAPPPSELSLYECHIGTLTPEGTFDAAIGQLPRIRELGVTAVEIMPVASFAGRWNWGYDGVALYAPAAVYGGPQGLRRLVDSAHQQGLAVLLDVVYNHFGPSGNYTGLYSDKYLTNKHSTPWGEALNFDDEGSPEVRRFFRENLLHWVHEYHIDGFRLDATHALKDDSPRHILVELTQSLEQAPRTRQRPYMTAETHENDPKYLKPTGEGGYGFDAVWSDDFHHVVRKNLTHEFEGYFANYEGTAEELARTVSQGFLYEGQKDATLGEARGKPAREQPWYQFIYCIQNHDQVGNRAFGDRMNVTASQADFLATSLLLLLLPQTPLLFQGQEFLSSSPFLFFTDHEPELGKLVTEGRRREFGSFGLFCDPRFRQFIPDPQAPETFERSKLRLHEGEGGTGRLGAELYRELLWLRHTDPVLFSARVRRSELRTVASGRAVLVTIGTEEGSRAIAVNLGEEQVLSAEGVSSYEVAVSSNEARFGGNDLASRIEGDTIILPAHCAVFLRPK